MALTGQLYPSYLDPYASDEAQVLDISSGEHSQELFTLGGGLLYIWAPKVPRKYPYLSHWHAMAVLVTP